MRFKSSPGSGWKQALAGRAGWGRVSPWPRSLLSGAVLLGAMAPLGFAQSNNTNIPSTPPKPQTVLSPVANRPPDANSIMIMREQKVKKQHFDAANAERQRQMSQDSANIVTLAMALRAELDKADSAELSESAMRKLEVIEKLAHAVKEKMKLTIGPN